MCDAKCHHGFCPISSLDVGPSYLSLLPLLQASVCMVKAEDTQALATSTDLSIRDQQITALVAKVLCQMICMRCWWFILLELDTKNNKSSHSFFFYCKNQLRNRLKQFEILDPIKLSHLLVNIFDFFTLETWSRPIKWCQQQVCHSYLNFLFYHQCAANSLCQFQTCSNCIQLLTINSAFTANLLQMRTKEQLGKSLVGEQKLTLLRDCNTYQWKSEC